MSFIFRHIFVNLVRVAAIELFKFVFSDIPETVIDFVRPSLFRDSEVNVRIAVLNVMKDMLVEKQLNDSYQKLAKSAIVSAVKCDPNHKARQAALGLAIEICDDKGTFRNAKDLISKFRKDEACFAQSSRQRPSRSPNSLGLSTISR